VLPNIRTGRPAQPTQPTKTALYRAIRERFGEYEPSDPDQYHYVIGVTAHGVRTC
jgi:hypothetical protein